MTTQTKAEAKTSGMPEGEELRRQIQQRKNRGQIWFSLFQLSLIIAIIALIILLSNIINQTFGLSAVENKIDPESLVQAAFEKTIVGRTDTTTSEDDATLSQSIAANPNAIGFLGYAYYREKADALRVLAVENVEPTEETVTDNSYPLSRPLFVYTSQETLKEKPQAAEFLNYYLDTVDSVIGEVGYFPVDQATLDAARATLAAATAAGDSEGEDNPIAISGSSTVYPLTAAIVESFQAAGYPGAITLESVGTKAGYAALCADRTADIANASRRMTRQEAAACSKNRRTPVEIQVGADALALVVSQENDWAQDLTLNEIQKLFTVAQNWSDVREGWPDEPIERFIPSLESGTLDFFVEKVYVDSYPLEEMPAASLKAMLLANISTGRARALEAQQPFDERNQAQMLELVRTEVVQPRVVASWNALPSLFNRSEIEARTLDDNPEAELHWKSWLSWEFLTSTQSSVPEYAGIRTAFLGTLWVMAIVILFSVPVGVGAAIYLEEYSKHGRINDILQTNIDNLAGVPSIIYGILGLTIFVRVLEPITSGKAFGLADPTTANGRTILAAGLTLGLLVLPIIIINAQEAIRAVPQAYREAGYGMGGTRWQVIRSHVLPSALPGILTGTILGISRAIGETAPVVVIGASTFITVDPNGPFSKFTVLPMQIFQWTTRPQPEFRHIAAAASIVLLILMFTLNGTAIYMRNRYSRK
ncbi:MAG: phosphate ABC transporter permease PstA [Caldilineaceae bacterium]|nr:phosphate ABC transporter permease PstA [Caldilineaceae bacterium]